MSAVRGTHLAIDAYNVLMTIANYRYGRIVYLATDGFARDVGEHLGMRPFAIRLEHEGELLLDTVARAGPASVELVVDRSVDGCDAVAGYLTRGLLERGGPGRAHVTAGVDRTLWTVQDRILATADSEIIDRSRAPVLDLAHRVLEERYQPELLDLRRLLDDSMRAGRA